MLEQIGAGFAIEFVLGQETVSGGGVAGNSQLLYLAGKSLVRIPLLEDAALTITMNSECSPDEARRFLGLPDDAPTQEGCLKE